MVIDMGSGCMRLGFAGEDMPKSVFPTATGVLEAEVSMSSSTVLSELDSGCIEQP